MHYIAVWNNVPGIVDFNINIDCSRFATVLQGDKAHSMFNVSLGSRCFNAYLTAEYLNNQCIFSGCKVFSRIPDVVHIFT